MKLELIPRTDLAVRALRFLADHETRTSEQIAGAIDSTPQHVQHVMAPLTTAGWVSSRRGPLGGYTMKRDINVSVLDVVEAVEGPTETGRCVLRRGTCLDTGPCALHEAWVEARQALVDALADRSIFDIPVQKNGD